MARKNNTDLKDVWKTPDELISILEVGGSIDLDPCAAPDSGIAVENWTDQSLPDNWPDVRQDTEYDVDGLSRDWYGRVFVNPPFTQKKDWLEKAVKESVNAEVIFVVTPDSTDTISWWHEYIAQYADYIWFSRGRISYINPETGDKAGSATFGTAISIFGDVSDEVLDELKENGQLVQNVT